MTSFCQRRSKRHQDFRWPFNGCQETGRSPLALGTGRQAQDTGLGTVQAVQASTQGPGPASAAHAPAAALLRMRTGFPGSGEPHPTLCQGDGGL